MKKQIIILLTMGLAGCMASETLVPVMVTTNGELRAPTNFFNANSNQIAAAATNSTWQSITNYVAAATNGLASTNYVSDSTNAVWQSATNYVAAATNGLASTNYVASATNALAGTLTWGWTYHQPRIYDTEILTNWWMRLDGVDNLQVAWTNWGTVNGMAQVGFLIHDDYDRVSPILLRYLYGGHPELVFSGYAGQPLPIKISDFGESWLGTDANGWLINRGWPTNMPAGQQITDLQLQGNFTWDGQTYWDKTSSRTNLSLYNWVSLRPTSASDFYYYITNAGDALILRGYDSLFDETTTYLQIDYSGGDMWLRGYPHSNVLGSAAYTAANVMTNGQLYSSVRYQLTQHNPDSNGTNYILDFNGPSSRSIVCADNVNFSSATNLTTGFEISVTYTIYPNGANRTISWPTNWQTLSSNTFNSPVTLTNGRIARIAFSFIGISSSETNILVGGVQQ